MNWDNQLSSILSAADGSVAKIRARLSSPGTFPKGARGDVFSVREMVSHLDPPIVPLPVPQTALPSQLLSSSGLGVQWEDLSAIQTQLQIQSQAVESLTKRLHDMERERRSQQHQIQTLQEEVHGLREESKEREREWDEVRMGQGPRAARMLDQWRREVGRELSSLRGHVSSATSLGNLEESLSSKLRREELEHLRREVDQLKTRLRRQEEDSFVQQSEARESRRQYEHSCKTLEELTDTYRTHSNDLAKTVSQYTHTQQEVCQLRITVSELKDDVRCLILKEHQPTSLLSPPTSMLHVVPGAASVTIPSNNGSCVRGREAEPDSDSEDLSPTPSLAEVSSDDLSWLEQNEPALHQKSVRRVPLSTRPRRRDLDSPDSDLDEVPGADIEDDDDDDDNIDLESDLSLNDL